MNILVFDIETVPDVEGGRRLYHLSDLNDQEVAEKKAAENTDNNTISWECGKCTFINKITSKYCIMCFESRTNIPTK